jgi:hypothetical protein
MNVRYEEYLLSEVFANVGWCVVVLEVLWLRAAGWLHCEIAACNPLSFTTYYIDCDIMAFGLGLFISSRQLTLPAVISSAACS